MAQSLAPNARSDAAETAGGAGLPLALLLVEDEECLSVMLQQLLRRAQVRVFHAADGEGALKLLQQCGPEIGCAMVDCQLPDMDGGELCRKLRSLAPGMPLLLTSGRDQQALQRALEGSGRTGFLPKPYMPREVLDRVSGLLRAA